MHQYPTNERICTTFQKTDEYVTFLVKDNQVLIILNKIWNQISKGTITEFDSQPAFLNTKIVSYDSKINSNFCGNNTKTKFSLRVSITNST